MYDNFMMMLSLNSMKGIKSMNRYKLRAACDIDTSLFSLLTLLMILLELDPVCLFSS